MTMRAPSLQAPALWQRRSHTVRVERSGTPSERLSRPSCCPGSAKLDHGQKKPRLDQGFEVGILHHSPSTLLSERPRKVPYPRCFVIDSSGRSIRPLARGESLTAAD